MKTILALITFSTVLGGVISGEEQGLPFCRICDCTGNAIEIRCKEAARNYFFDPAMWMNSSNVSYPYVEMKIYNSALVSLDKEFPISPLKVMDLSENSIKNITDNVFKNLQDLEVLILSRNDIEVLHPDAFKGKYLEGDLMPLKSLIEIKLDHNRLHSLDANIFEHTSRVKKLDLSYNPLKTIDQQTLIAITSLYHLERLDLSYTGISTLPQTFLHTPKYLKFFELSGNKIEEIPQGLIESHSLEKLVLNNNPIVNLTEKKGFPKIKTLKILHMCNMPKLERVEKGSLSQLMNLEELHMSDNIELKYIDPFALSSKEDEMEAWPPLKKLYLSNNKLTSIEMHLYPLWDKLVDLDLHDNPWTCASENQWIVDELMPVFVKINASKAAQMKCAAPIEMTKYTFVELSEKKIQMRPLDIYGAQPDKDAALLVGTLVGILLAIPLTLGIIFAYKRQWFGLCGGSPASFSRQFYKPTRHEDIYNY